MVSTFPPLKYSAKIHLRNFSAHAFGQITPLPPKNSAWCKISFRGSLTLTQALEGVSVFSPDISLRVSIKVRICLHLLIPRGHNLFKRIQQGYSVILMSYKQPNSKSEGCIKNSSDADRSDCCCSNATRCFQIQIFCKCFKGQR